MCVCILITTKAVFSSKLDLETSLLLHTHLIRLLRRHFFPSLDSRNDSQVLQGPGKIQEVPLRNAEVVLRNPPGDHLHHSPAEMESI